MPRTPKTTKTITNKRANALRDQMKEQAGDHIPATQETENHSLPVTEAKQDNATAGERFEVAHDAGHVLMSNAPEKTVMIGVRVPASKRMELKIWAAAHDMSVNAIVERMIDQLTAGTFDPTK